MLPIKCGWLIVLSYILKVIVAETHTDNTNLKDAANLDKAPYERTFIKYHHRRKINTLISPDYDDFSTLNNEIERFKRNLEPNISDVNSNSEYQNSVPNEKSEKDDIIEQSNDSSNKRAVDQSTDGKSTNAIDNRKSLGKVEGKTKYKVKAAIVVTSAPTTEGPRHICLHKYHQVAQSEKISAVVGTLSPAEEKDDELYASDKVDEPGPTYNRTLPDGSTVLVEECAHSCYTLWVINENGTSGILGQGCWRTSSAASQRYEAPGCGGARCVGAPAKLPDAYFCCCSGDLCNNDVVASPEGALTTPTAASRGHPAPSGLSWTSVGTFVGLVVAAILVLIVVLATAYVRRGRKEAFDSSDVEKAADGMGGGPDGMATGLLCVDNLALIEHIGSGKFGSVWRGTLGCAPVAVKLYGGAAHWRREAQLYSTLQHPNLLRYYGSETRPTLTEGGGRQHLIVLELCSSTLRQRLQTAPLTWQQFAALAHGLASAVAYLHSVQTANAVRQTAPLTWEQFAALAHGLAYAVAYLHSVQTANGVNKSCVVHRDINSNNVLVTSDGRARLADLGLAVAIQSLRAQPRPHRITEAGTLRYLSPEALEGALDLAGARAALCAVDVFALALVLWEMLWRTAGAHAGATPPHAAPYEHAGLGRDPTLAQMQALVSRGKVRPPLPRGPVAEARALRLAADTCDECWDHDAEARLTAVCVEERLSELRQLLQPAAPLVRDNNLRPHAATAHADSGVPAQENDKNSNCVNPQACDVTTPLLYAQPHIGRNPCLERNTHTHTQNNTQLIHKSLKDIAQVTVDGPRIQNIDDNCLSVARVSSHRRYAERENSDRLNEIRSFQRPLDYIPNDVSCHDERQPKQTNLMNDVKIEKPKWGLGRLFGKRLRNAKPIETEVKLVPEGNHVNNSVVQSANGKFRTSVVVNEAKNTNGRPSNLALSEANEARASGFNFESPCTLSPPNRTLSPTMIMESQINKSDKVFAFKEMPHAKNYDDAVPKPPNQIFAVIVPKAKSNFIEMHSKSKGSSESIHKKSVNASISSQSLQAGQSESEDSTVKKNRLSCDDKIITSNQLGNSGNSSRASIEMELQYINGECLERTYSNDNDSRSYDINTDCSSNSEDENLMLLSENGGAKITMHPMPKTIEDTKNYQNDVLKEASVTKDFGALCNKFPKKGYSHFDNEFSDPNDKENVNGYSGDNPVYIAAIKGEIDTGSVRFDVDSGHCSPRRAKKRECKSESDDPPKSPKPSLKHLSIKRQHSLEQVSEIFSSSGDLSHLQNPAGRVKTPGDLPAAVRRARRDRALQKGRAQESNRLSLYDDRMMFGNSL